MERNIQELEKEALQVCQDFTAFCDYLTDNKVKLAKQTGNIGKKDCFALNALFYVREDYERPSNTQNKYPVINFFYYIAVRYRILEINFPGMTMRQGRNYQQFREASVWEQYALFLAVFLFEGRFAYPDFMRIDAGEPQESQSAVSDWEEYIKFHLNIDWRTAEILKERIPSMAATGVLQKEEIVAAYKEMLRGTGCRVTKRAESLIGALLMNVPSASQKGNARGEDPRGKDRVVWEKTLAQKTSEEKVSRQVKRPENTTEKGTEAEKTEAEEYIQLSIFDLVEPVAGESAGEK